MVLGDDKTDDDDEQPDRGDERDRKRDGDQHFDGGDRHVPIDVDNFPDDRRIPAARLVVDGPVISPALTRRPSLRPIPRFYAHSASIARKQLLGDCPEGCGEIRWGIAHHFREEPRPTKWLVDRHGRARDTPVLFSMTCTSEGSILRRRPPEINATIIFKVLEARPLDI
jgi:hypothetical protein